ncbi:DUF7716 domain-containing protein [Saccharothrix australiensis]|uniref:DUF7716 domain-containing protein n=1 Tax=Saccharothrix australiensis TaxID=2072 RepID=A0A495W1M0_9PSEU|nr:hypothetical protein [Saccharothrix australiensis]RKT55562.1 hypothetical protein C8E97_4238 [Saccharothrix australiensis]
MSTDERPWLTTWGEVVEALPRLGPDDLVCFGDGPTTPADPCLVVDATELGEDEDVPPEAGERGWHTVLGKDEVQGVLGNLRRQTADPDLDLIVRAVEHYVDHDAYLTID